MHDQRCRSFKVVEECMAKTWLEERDRRMSAVGGCWRRERVGGIDWVTQGDVDWAVGTHDWLCCRWRAEALLRAGGAEDKK